MRDYSQILTKGQGQQQQFTNDVLQSVDQPQQQPRRNRNSNRDRNRQQGQVFKKLTTRSLVNTLGASAETAKGLGIPKKIAHQIVDLAYRGGNPVRT